MLFLWHAQAPKGPIAANLNKQGYNFNTEHTILDDDGKKAGDAYVSNPYVDEPKTILDVTRHHLLPHLPHLHLQRRCRLQRPLHQARREEQAHQVRRPRLQARRSTAASSPLPSPPTEAGVMISRRSSSTPTTRRSSRPLARTASQAGPSSTIDRLRYERHVAAVICRENSRMLGSTLVARCRARAIQRSAPQQSPVADSDADP